MSRVLLLCLLAGAFLPAIAAADTASETLAKARQAEADGELETRHDLLAAALEAAPNDPAVRWQNGYVKLGTKWVKAEDFYRHAPAKAALEDYRELRKKSTPTVASQLQLADFCKVRGLKDQERVHLSALAELEPDNTAVRQRLGQQLVDGVWRTKEELDAARDAAKKVAEALRKSQGELNGLRQNLERGKITKAAAIAQLTKNHDAALIPAWELYLSSSAAGAEVVVAALSELSDDEASLSLARHALYSQHPAASKAATAALQSRNLHSFVPALLGALRSRWMSSTETLRSSGNRVVYRYTVFADGPDKQQLATLEDVFYLDGWLPDAARQTTAAAGANKQTIEQRRAVENQRIEQENLRVMALLRAVTGETEADSPQLWWQWWSEKNGIYFEGDKPLEQSYAANYTSIVGQPPPPPPSGAPTNVSRPPPRERDPKDCLAGGTPVWTDQGPVAVDRIKMGDLVLARDVKSGELAYKPVLRTTVRAPEKLLRIEFAKDTLRASAGHPFWVAGKGWMIARDLKPNMVLAGNPEPMVIQKITEEEKPVRSFNLVVDGFHSYFAGSSPVLSHDNSIREAAKLQTR